MRILTLDTILCLVLSKYILIAKLLVPLFDVTLQNDKRFTGRIVESLSWSTRYFLLPGQRQRESGYRGSLRRSGWKKPAGGQQLWGS